AVEAPAWVPPRRVRARELAANAALAIGAVMLVKWLLAPRPGFEWAMPTLVSPLVFELRRMPVFESAIVWLAAAAGLVGLRRLWRGAALMALLLVIATTPARALTHRSGTSVVVPAAETVDDTLVATGETVRIDGTI